VILSKTEPLFLKTFVRLVVALGAVSGGAVTPSAGASPEPADLVLRHGLVYTVDAARSWA
jgi:hypothetical protein